MNWDQAVAQCVAEFPKLKIVQRDSGAAGQAFWNTIYIRSDLVGKDAGVVVLLHEMVHIRDQHRWGPLLFISYYILPIGPSFKALWEWRAYKVTLEEDWKLVQSYNDPAYRDYLMGYFRDWVVSQFLQWSLYQWMWPFRKFVEKMVDEHIAKLKG